MIILNNHVQSIHAQNDIRHQADREVNNETQTAETEARCSLDMDLGGLRSDHSLLIQNPPTDPPSCSREQTLSVAASIPQGRKPASPAPFPNFYP